MMKATTVGTVATLLIAATIAAQINNEGGLLKNVVSHDYLPDGFEIDTPNKDEISINARIIGGRYAFVAEFPYQVGLLTFFSAGNVQLCGGSLISNNYILTAAHCVDGAVAANILIGATNLQDANQIEEKILVYSDAFTVHEEWNRGLAVNDLALIKLPKPVKLSKRVQTVNLPNRKLIQKDFVNYTTTASGWGRFTDQYNTPSAALKCVNLTVISESECKRYFSYAIRPTNLCVSGAQRKSTCAGDSGGPLVVKEKGENRTLLGVTSFGLRFGCELGYPSVFTRVTSYLDWISMKTGIKINE